MFMRIMNKRHVRGIGWIWNRNCGCKAESKEWNGMTATLPCCHTASRKRFAVHSVKSVCCQAQAVAQSRLRIRLRLRLRHRHRQMQLQSEIRQELCTRIMCVKAKISAIANGKWHKHTRTHKWINSWPKWWPSAWIKRIRNVSCVCHMYICKWQLGTSIY